MTRDLGFELDRLTRRDRHVHTPYCRHATGSMEECVLAAIDRGLDEIGFLEHAEAGIVYHVNSWPSPEELDLYWEEGQRLADRYAGRIHVSVGLEIGVNPDRLDDLLALAHRYPWTHLGLAFHYIAGPGTHLNICSSRDPNRSLLRGLDPVAATLRYYETLTRHLAVFEPDWVCHLDVTRRSLPDLTDHPAVRAAIDALLAEMARLGTALEINTSGYRHVGGLFPAPRLLRTALDMGLPLVLNSDSHAPAHVARDFDRAVAEVRAVAVAPADTLDNQPPDRPPGSTGP